MQTCAIEISNICNFNCRHCYLLGSKPQNMPVEMFKKIINQLKDLKCSDILITGGEPLLHPDFKELYTIARDSGFTVGLNTNASLLDEDMISFLKSSPPKIIEVSLYGINDETYHFFTKRSSMFEVIDTNLKNAIKAGLNITTKSIPTKDNKEYFHKIEEYADLLGLEYRYDFILFPALSCQNYCRNKSQLSDEEIIKILDQDYTSRNYFINKLESGNKNSVVCSGGENSLFINASGDIGMCVVLMSDFNLNTVGLSAAIDHFRTMKKSKFNNNSCLSCENITVCRVCPGKFALETNDYNTPPTWYCHLYKNIVTSFKPIINNKLGDKQVEDIFGIIRQNLIKFQNISPSKEDYKIWRENILNNPTLNTNILYIGNTPAGYIQFTLDNSTIFINEIQIALKYQGDGYSFRKLISSALSDLDYQDIKLNINPSNQKSLNVFTSIGFKRGEKNIYFINSDLFNLWLNKKTTNI